MTASALPPFKDLVYRKEQVYYALMLVISLAAYGGLGYAAWLNLELIPGIIGYVVVFGIAIYFAQGMALGRIRGSAIKVGPRQLPLVHKLVHEHSALMQLKSVPDVYVIQAGGMMNAFATRFGGRNFVVIFSDVLEMAMNNGEPAVGFIVAHELAHHKRGHLRFRWLTLPGRVVPYLGFAYSRACEYTCDRFAARCQPDGAVAGLLAMAAGKEVYKAVDPAEFAKQATTENDFWVRRSELISTHPRLPKRVAEVIKIGAQVPSYTPMLVPEREGAAAAN